MNIKQAAAVRRLRKLASAARVVRRHRALQKYADAKTGLSKLKDTALMPEVLGGVGGAALGSGLGYLVGRKKRQGGLGALTGALLGGGLGVGAGFGWRQLTKDDKKPAAKKPTAQQPAAQQQPGQQSKIVNQPWEPSPYAPVMPPVEGYISVEYPDRSVGMIPADRFEALQEAGALSDHEVILPENAWSLSQVKRLSGDGKSDADLRKWKVVQRNGALPELVPVSDTELGDTILWHPNAEPMFQ